ncbi:alpha/beta fold hydrolase [Aeromicrobium choanae]|uniref:Pimeloyl-ACP methyl ester carboxylesterase n=1 Tax=Aeromicrobium choanae TaxID=1736691 RepID=A0A1T4YW06_9ACTN|nr:alpha/beta fold hydrolase [Aeromicrobium choanae]SKB05984.1 Pimeloyl-ACP methyl ester carboxylesterase [Aeromicrobium choanae]
MSATIEVVEAVAGPFEVLSRPGTTEPVLAVHGVSSNNRLWSWVLDAAPEVSMIAPDLAGRGGSPARPGPSSVAEHADQLVTLLDALGLDRVHLLGMSLGGFIVSELAARHPERVRTVTLVDGGLPLDFGEQGPPPAAAVASQFRAQYAADRVWADESAYLDHYRGSVAPLTGADDPRMRTLVGHDLAEVDGGLSVHRDLETVVDDAVSVFTSEAPAAALAAVRAPMRLVYAPWSIGVDSAPMYASAHVERLVATTPSLVSAALVDGVDHAAIIMTDHGAAACAAALRANLES